MSVYAEYKGSAHTKCRYNEVGEVIRHRYSYEVQIDLKYNNRR